MPQSCSSVIIFANAAENAIPINIKFSTGEGIRYLLHSIPSRDVISIPTIIMHNESFVFLHFLKAKPAGIPAAAPIISGRNIITGII